MHGSVAPLAAEWDALADRLGAPLWARPAWTAAWWRAFGRGELEVLAARENGSLTGVLPVERLGPLVRSAANWHTPEFVPLTEGAGAEKTLAGGMLRDAPRRVELRLVAAGAALAVELARTAAGHRLLTRTYLRSPYLDIDGDWDAFLRARTSRYRSNYRRGLKQLEAQGAVELALAEGEAGVARFDEALAVEASGWKGADGTAIVSSPETHAFYSEIVVWAAERGALRLVSLDVDGRMLAFVFGVREGTTFFELKTGFDNAHAHARPGAVLHHLLLARLFREGLARYEFLGRDDPWKLWLASGTHERVLLQVFAPGAAGLADWAAFRYGRPVVKRLLTTATSFRGRRR